MRIKVQLPSVWRADEYLADNYNPLKGNKSTIMLFRGGWCGLLSVWLAASWGEAAYPRALQFPATALTTAPGIWRSEVKPEMTSITPPLSTLHVLIWWLIHLGWTSMRFCASWMKHRSLLVCWRNSMPQVPLSMTHCTRNEIKMGPLFEVPLQSEEKY